MRRLSRSEERTRICVPVIETTVEKAREAIKEANHVADLIELRTDYLKDHQWATLMMDRRKPFIITNRGREEGGRFRGNERERFRILKEAVLWSAEFVDIEMRSNRSLLRNMIENRNGTKIILSRHNFYGTPSPKELRSLFDRMIRLRPDVVKIVTFARSLEDNLNVLSLIPYALGEKKKIVAFCMGEKGKMSRIFSPVLGAAWTFASLSRDRASAPGQLTAGQMRDIWKSIRVGTNRNDCVGTTAIPARIDTVVPTPDHGRLR